MKNKCFLVIIFLGFVGASSLVSAAPPYNPNLVTNGNLWTITGYRDSHFNHVWQSPTWKLCFQIVNEKHPCYTPNAGEHQSYTWTSNFPNWNGCARQEGDQIFMHGDYGNNLVHDSMDWEIVTKGHERTLGAGHWKEWRENSKYGDSIGFANAVFIREGDCGFQKFLNKQQKLKVRETSPLSITREEYLP